jgi:hypothetical protein
MEDLQTKRIQGYIEKARAKFSTLSLFERDQIKIIEQTINAKRNISPRQFDTLKEIARKCRT